MKTQTMFHTSALCPRIAREFPVQIDQHRSHLEMIHHTRAFFVFPGMLDHAPPWKQQRVERVDAALIQMNRDYTLDEANKAVISLGCMTCPDNSVLWSLGQNTKFAGDTCEKSVMDPGTTWDIDDGHIYVAGERWIPAGWPRQGYDTSVGLLRGDKIFSQHDFILAVKK